MGNSWLLLDCNSISYVAYYAISKELTFENIRTDVIYGFMSLSLQLINEFSDHIPLFCWDHGFGKRKTLYPGYKAKRDLLPPEELKKREEFKDQIELIKFKYLPEMKVTNNFYADGYEADDIIASLVKNLKPKDSAIIVSGDQDLYQLLRDKVHIFCPRYRTLTTKGKFLAKYGIPVSQWAFYKALAGCTSDCIPGCPGIGSKKAIQFIKDELPNPAKIEHFLQTDTYKLFKKLTTVPLEGCPEFSPVVENISTRDWRKLASRLGMQTLRRKLNGQGRTV